MQRLPVPLMEPPFIQANTSGRLHDAREPSISVLDRGFLYGDSVYEVWRTYDGAIFAFDEHWQRLERSARALQLALPVGREALAAELVRTAAAYVECSGHVGPIYIRAQCTRGAGGIGLDTTLAENPTYVLIAQRLRALPVEKLRTGLVLSVARTLRRNPREALDPEWKTGNSLNTLLCLREARSRGADEVLILNLAGQLTEAATANIFFVRRNTIVTPPLSSGLLGGITRALLLERIAARIGATAIEEVIAPADLRYFDSCFLASTINDLVPVAAIDAQCYPVDELQLVWKLKAAFQNYASEYAIAHPQLRVDTEDPTVAAGAA